MCIQYTIYILIPILCKFQSILGNLTIDNDLVFTELHQELDAMAINLISRSVEKWSRTTPQP